MNNRYAFHCLSSLVLLIVTVRPHYSFASSLNLPYSGRLVQDDGKPIDGPVDLVVELFARENDQDSASGPHVFPNLDLQSGVFQVNIPLTNAELNKIFTEKNQLPYIQVTDATNSTIYPKQHFAAAPMALRVPVDNETIGFNSDGNLFLKKALDTNKVGGEMLETSGAGAGQVLTWDSAGKKWKPTDLPSVSEVGTGAISDGAINAAKIAHTCATEEVLTIAANGTDFECKTYTDGDIRNGGNSSGTPLVIGSSDTQPLHLKTDDDNRLTILQTGEVGIGKEDPAAALDVSGTMRAQEICDESGGNCKDVSLGWDSGGSVTSVSVNTSGDGLSLTGDSTITTSGSFTLGLSGDVAAIEGISGTGIALRTGANTWSTLTDNSTNWNTAYDDRLKWDGASTGLDASLGRASLGLGSLATQSSVDLSTGAVTNSLPLTKGGTGATTATAARSTLGLGSSATLDIGTTSGTVAAGNDSRLAAIANKVEGPGSAVDNGLVRFDGSTGKLVQGNTGITVTDSGNIGIATPATSAILSLGPIDSGTSSQHIVTINGSGSGTVEGAQIDLHLAADHDSSFESIGLDTYEDDFRIIRGRLRAS